MRLILLRIVLDLLQEFFLPDELFVKLLILIREIGYLLIFLILPDSMVFDLKLCILVHFVEVLAAHALCLQVMGQSLDLLLILSEL